MNRKRDVNAIGDGGGHGQPRWITGLNAVARRIATRPRTVREIQLVDARSGRRASLAAAAAAVGIPVRQVDAAALRRLTGSDGHQGVAALTDPFRYQELEAVLAESTGPLLVLDQIQDPHNLGALIRTAAAVGMTAVIIPRHGAAGVSAAVEKVAAGAVNDIPICQVTNIQRLLLNLRPRGYWSIGLTPHGGQNLFETELPGTPALVLGGEAGLRPLVEKSCDLRITIPIRPGVESLNASVAGAVAMYDLARRFGSLTG